VVDNLEFTGERFTPECEREIWYEHLHRYALAARLCRGANVLDAACGEGYGSSLLAQDAASVIGVDVDEQTVQHAGVRYSNQDNLEFRTADCTQLPFNDDHFDVIISFETLEHLSAQEALISEFHRVLKPEGFLMLSSPDKAEYSEKQGNQNEFHIKELYREELVGVISVKFPVCHLFGQKLMFHSAIWDLQGVGDVDLQTFTSEGNVSNGKILHSPTYFIALCAASEEYLPDLSGSLSLFDDIEESVYTHYHHEIRKNMAAGGALAELDAQVNALKAELQRRQPSWWQRLLGKN
jgi:protein-L-isoaspartate O-methyltransferase